MDRRPNTSLRMARCLLAAVALAIVVADADAQIRGRFYSRRELKDLEKYYDDLEDFYKDRNPRLAREAERMEHYYEDLRKGRAVGPPPVLPGLRAFVDSRLMREEYVDPQTAELHQQRAEVQPRNRWQAWRNRANPDSALEPTDAPRPTEGPLLAAPSNRFKSPSPALAPTPAEMRRVPTNGRNRTVGLRFPSASATEPVTPLEQAHARLLASLEQLTATSPTAARWIEHLSLPSSNSPELSSQDYYSTEVGRARLAQALTRFDRVASDPRYRAVAQLAGFNAARNELRNVVASLEQQPTLAEPPAIEVEELPAPPIQ